MGSRHLQLSRSSLPYHLNMINLLTPVPCAEKSASQKENSKGILSSMEPLTAFVIDKQEFDCQLCHKKCYSLAGLKSHLRAHERNN